MTKIDGKYLGHDVARENRADGTILLRSAILLGEVVNDTNVWLKHWAEAEPHRIFLGQREGESWRTISYADMWRATRSAAQGLLDHGVNPGDTVLALSGPSIDHAILMQACQMIGAPIVPLAEQYSLLPEARSKLAYCVNKLSVAAVFAAESAPYADSLKLPLFADALRITSDGGAENSIAFDTLLDAKPGAQLDEAYARVGPETIAKILFTSGSTSQPKGVPNTQRMMCVNQAQYLGCLPILGAQHHTMLDWLPWNHTFAANSNYNMMLSNGGSLYLDAGKPVPGHFETTLENAAQIPVTLSCDVPVAHAMRVEAMKQDVSLRSTYFGNLEIFFYAGASLPTDVWSAVEELALSERAETPLMMSSWGMTETAPATLVVHQKGSSAGNIGVPMPGATVKLVPLSGNRFELRCTGPNVFDGYHDDPARTQEAFDEEGFFITGDAVGLVDPEDASKGLFFDGRIKEDFKLITGTWVQASTLRLKALSALSGLALDVVIAGEGRNDVGVLIFAAENSVKVEGDVLLDDELDLQVRKVLTILARSATGSANRLSRALIMAEPPSIADGEITAKGSLNVRAILDRRAHLVTRLYDDADPATIRIGDTR